MLQRKSYVNTITWIHLFLFWGSDENTSNEEKCDDGWILMSGSCYMLSTNKMDWSNAKYICISNKANLITVNSLEELVCCCLSKVIKVICVLSYGVQWMVESAKMTFFLSVHDLVGFSGLFFHLLRFSLVSRNCPPINNSSITGPALIVAGLSKL